MLGKGWAREEEEEEEGLSVGLSSPSSGMSCLKDAQVLGHRVDCLSRASQLLSGTANEVDSLPYP